MNDSYLNCSNFSHFYVWMLVLEVGHYGFLSLEKSRFVVQVLRGLSQLDFSHPRYKLAGFIFSYHPCYISVISQNLIIRKEKEKPHGSCFPFSFSTPLGG